MKFRKVKKAKKEYALYVPDQRAEYEVIVNDVVVAYIKARHVHASSWSWEARRPGEQRPFASAGTRNQLLKQLEAE